MLHVPGVIADVFNFRFDWRHNQTKLLWIVAHETDVTERWWTKFKERDQCLVHHFRSNMERMAVVYQNKRKTGLPKHLKTGHSKILCFSQFSAIEDFTSYLKIFRQE